MPFRAKVLIAALMAASVCILIFGPRLPHSAWLVFWICLGATLVSSKFKVPRPSGSGSMSLNYPFVFLSIIHLAPFQACLVAAISVAAQCRIQKFTVLAIVQCCFNIANSICSTAIASICYVFLIGRGVAVPPALSIAAIAYFFCNTIPVASVIGWSQQVEVVQLWRKEFRWFLPFYLVGAALAAIAHFVLVRSGWTTALLMIPMAYTLYRAYVAQVNQLQERRDHLQETEALHLRAIEALAMAIEAKDQNTHEHLFRVRDYVAKVADRMHLDQEQRRALRTAAFLHDIGKLAVPEHIINKPGKLTADEFEKMKIHPAVGADILERVRFPYPVVPIVRSHHERWDGQGYPDGLQGEDIPIGARILSVVDCFDALASDRPYRKAMPAAKAMELVKSMAGSQFDPAIVDVLEQCYVEIEQTSQKMEHFQALNLDLDTQRGSAPAAGLEQGRDKEDETPGVDSAAEILTSQQSLSLIAAAHQEAQWLYELSREAGGSLSMRDTARLMSSCLRSLIPFDCCVLYFKDGEAVTARYVDERYVPSFRSEPIPLGEGLSGWIAQSGRSILNGNATVEPTYCANATGALELNSALAMPLVDLHGNVYGVLTLYAKAIECFTRDHLRMLQSAETRFSLAIQNALRFGKGENNPGTDSLTGLSFLRNLLQRLDAELHRCRQEHCQLALVACDLSACQGFSNREGHLAGNYLLRSIATHLQKQCRISDTLARTSEGDFIFILGDLTASIPSERVECLHEAIRHAVEEAHVKANASASFGISLYPEDGNTAEELLAVADRRMFLNKQQHHSKEDLALPSPAELKPRLVA